MLTRKIGSAGSSSSRRTGSSLRSWCFSSACWRAAWGFSKWRLVSIERCRAWIRLSRYERSPPSPMTTAVPSKGTRTGRLGNATRGLFRHCPCFSRHVPGNVHCSACAAQKSCGRKLATRHWTSLLGSLNALQVEHHVRYAGVRLQPLGVFRKSGAPGWHLFQTVHHHFAPPVYHLVDFRRRK